MNEVTFDRSSLVTQMKKGQFYFHENEGQVYILFIKGTSFILVSLNDGSWWGETPKDNPLPNFLNGFTLIQGEIKIVTE